MTFDLWLGFVAASIILLLIPGPTILLVLSYALSQGRRVALATAAGVALGDFIAMSASLAGLGALVLASATLFTALKWIGAAYLVFLGIRLIRGASAMRLDCYATGAERGSHQVARQGNNLETRSDPTWSRATLTAIATDPVRAGRGAFGHAAAVTVLNPKSIAFFIAFVPQFLRPEAPLAPQFAILIATFVALAAVNAFAYALLADRLRRNIGRPMVLTALTRLGGGTLIAMGIATAMLRRG